MSARLAARRRPRPPCQDFAASVPATRGLIAAPWTPLASLCSVEGHRLVTASETSLSQRRYLHHRRRSPRWRSAQPVLAQGDHA